ncbi:hypothetical protein [Burkholderia sp. CCA53]|uniref:hypothetical protein n=1 Tax=Burkholderia sp. CCA53 TaxID=1776288 RepID=UPI000A4F94ED|nr:hypothetical protein [Burkholderia sp. CCA53]
MASNDFKVFASGPNANVMTQADYAALAALVSGFQSGTAKSEQVNKVLRQASIIAAMIGQFIVDKSGQSAVDDGTIATLESNFSASIQAMGDARYAQLAGLATQVFSVANATASTHALNRQTADSRYAALAGSGTQTFDVANPTSIGTQAINGQYADARYAQIAGNTGQVFSAEWSSPGTQQVVPRNQADALYAALAGNASQAFNVAQGLLNNQAVRLDQFQGALTTNGWVSFPNTSGIYRTIVIQWGVITAPANSNNSYSLSTSFINGAFSCVASRFAGGSNASVNANPVGKSQIQIQNYGSSSESVGYLIIGN